MEDSRQGLVSSLSHIFVGVLGFYGDKLIDDVCAILQKMLLESVRLQVSLRQFCFWAPSRREGKGGRGGGVSGARVGGMGGVGGGWGGV